MTRGISLFTILTVSLRVIHEEKINSHQSQHNLDFRTYVEHTERIGECRAPLRAGSIAELVSLTLERSGSTTRAAASRVLFDRGGEFTGDKGFVR